MLDLEAIKERIIDAKTRRGSSQRKSADELAHIDAQSLVAEVERLRAAASALARGVRLLEAGYDDADERRPKWLQAALDAVERT